MEIKLKTILEPMILKQVAKWNDQLEEKGFGYVIGGGDVIEQYVPTDESVLTSDVDLKNCVVRGHAPDINRRVVDSGLLIVNMAIYLEQFLVNNSYGLVTYPNGKYLRPILLMKNDTGIVMFEHVLGIGWLHQNNEVYSDIATSNRMMEDPTNAFVVARISYRYQLEGQIVTNYVCDVSIDRHHQGHKFELYKETEPPGPYYVPTTTIRKLNYITVGGLISELSYMINIGHYKSPRHHRKLQAILRALSSPDLTSIIFVKAVTGIPIASNMAVVADSEYLKIYYHPDDVAEIIEVMGPEYLVSLASRLRAQ